MKKALIIGGGFAGCAAAHQLELLGGYEVVLVERSSFLGAGNKTRWYGGHPYTFGPRHFLTTYEQTYEYLNSIVPLRLCPEHEFLTYVEKDNDFYAYPINHEDVMRMPDSKLIYDELENASINKEANVLSAKNLEEYWIASVGTTLFEKMINTYSKKMWKVSSCRELDTFSWSPKGVAISEGPKAAWTSAISGYPYDSNGYDAYFPFATKEAKVLFNTTATLIDIDKKSFSIDGDQHTFDVVINTIAPDVFMNFDHGPLRYIGRELKLIVFPSEFIFPENVYFLYYANNEDFTRLVEYKKFTHHKSNTTLIGMEIPAENGGFEYPMPLKSEQHKCLEYFNRMPKGCFSIGRAGSYLYGVDIDDCILQSMLLAENLRDDSQDHPVPGSQYRFPELN